ncbi:MAG: recombinase family protein [Albidovulum sp.]|nr:recombinase family protein [Albidovulum sp.]
MGLAERGRRRRHPRVRGRGLGRTRQAPGPGQLIDHAQPGDSLCVNRLDRLGRSLKELLETVEDLKSRGIHLVSLEKRIDTTSAAGEPVFHVFGAIAHFERRLISERTRDGIEAARKRGRKPGRPPLSGEKVSAAQMLIGAGTAPARPQSSSISAEQRPAGSPNRSRETRCSCFAVP